MHFRTKLVAPLALAVLGLPLAAQLPLKNALPESTIAYVALPDLNSSLEEMQGMPLMRMWNEAEVQDFFADVLKMGEAKWDEALEQARMAHQQGQIPVDPDEVLKLRVVAAGFALTSLEMSNVEGEPSADVGLIAQFDFGESAESWRKLIGFGLQMLEAQAGGELKKEEAEVGGVKLITMVPPITGMSINVAFVGNGLVFGTRQSEVKSVLENLASGTKSLTASKNFTAAFGPLARQGAEMEAYFQPAPMLDFAMAALAVAREEEPEMEMIDPKGVRRALEALGLYSLHAFGATASYAEGSQGAKSVTRGFIHAPAPTRVGMLAGSHKELDTSFLKWVPKDVASFSAATLDLSAFYDGLINAVKAYDEQMAEQALGMLAHYEKQFDVSIKGDLVGSLGNEIITWSMPVAAFGTTPEMAVLVKVNDEEKLLKTLRTIAKLTDGMFDLDESERRGITVYQIQINYDPTGGMGMNPLDMVIPTFSFKNGYMVAGFSTGDVKRVFKRMDREDDPSGDIRSNGEFKPYLAQLPEKGLNSLSFTDWKANFEGIYQLVTSLAAFVPVDEDIPIDLSLLPDVTTLTQHLFGSVSYTITDGTGFHTMSQGPWGPEVWVIGGALIGVGVGAAVGMQTEQRFR